MKSLSIILLAMTAFADSGTTFEVKEIPAIEFGRLESADSNLEKAMAALAIAQVSVEKAKSERNDIALGIQNRFVAFEGQCTYPAMDSNTGIHHSGSLRFRRVEIRGKYALITEGKESCGISTSGSGAMVTGTNDLVFRQ